MNCTIHPHQEASGICSYCGRPFCSECLVSIDGKIVCKDDVNHVYQNAKSQAPPITHVSNFNYNYGNISPKSRTVALILCILIGEIGIHRFYTGKVGTGILYLCTAGLCGIGWIYDIIKIATGTATDGAGRIISNW